MCDIAKTKTGIVNTTLSSNLRVIDWSSASLSSSLPIERGFNSSAIPHWGQSPGASLSMPGHMGQKYFDAGGLTAAEGIPPPQQ
jgi:hypothetical protein